MAAGPDSLTVDVAVAGAGPAGAAAAAVCAQGGLEVLLLDRERFPRERVGETLHPGVEGPLRRLGVLERVRRAGFPRHDGVFTRWDGPGRLVRYGADADGPWRGFQAWRADLDAILLARAERLGATVRQPCRALEPVLRDGRVSGLETSSGRVGARFVLDAAGSGHWLGRQLRLGASRRSPRLVARFGYVEGRCAARDAHPAMRADPRGWSWVARVRPELYTWTRLDLEPGAAGGRSPPEELRSLRPRGPVRGADVSWRAVDQPAGPGYLLVGDAAAVLDPASSHGVLKALLSGILAGQLVLEAAIGGRGEESVARDYRAWWAAAFERDVAALSDLYRRLPDPPPWLRASRARHTWTMGV